MIYRIAQRNQETSMTVSTSELPAPQALFFETPDSTIANALELANTQFSQLISSQAVHIARIPFGSRQIKSLKCSPDALVQMIIQLAYRRVHGVNRPTYESAQTRKYILGRTETRRVVTEASVRWCQAMLDPSTSLTEKIVLGRKALDEQVKGMSEAVKGFGVDRHLLGLRKCILPGEATPEVFQDPAFSYSCHWYL